MNITKVLDECDTRRLSAEGVGLSDDLVKIIVFAYTEGVKFAYAQKEGVKPATNVTASKNDCIELIIMTKEELYMNQAPSFNFEKNADELLHQALLSGFVDQVGPDQYVINMNYPEERES